MQRDETGLSLRQAIEQSVGLGETDPASISRQVIARYGVDLVLAEVDPAKFAEDFARRVIGERRRTGIRSIVRGKPMQREAVMLQIVWLPGLGYVKLGELTADQFDAAAASSRKAASTISRYAEWYEQQAALMRAQGATHYREVVGELPELPQVAA